MASFILAVVSLWRTLNVELVIFLVTLTFAFAFRGMSAKLSTGKPHKTSKLGKGLKDASNTSSDRPATPQKPRRAVAPRSTRACATEPQWPKVAVVQRRRQPTQLLDEVVDGMRDQPGTRFAARALDLYAELQELLRRDGLRLVDVTRGAKHSPIDFYTTLVQCVVRIGQCHLVEDIIHDMVQQGISRPLLFYESTMKQLAGQKHYHLALRVYDRLAADGLEPSAVTCSCLISFAAEIGELQRAAGFFEKLSSLTTPSIRAYMTVLRVHGRRQDWHASLATFRDMQQRGVHIDSLVLNVILATGVSADQLAVVEALLAEADNFQPPITDVVSYNTVAKCYAQHNDFDGAATVITRIRRRGLKPNAITFNSVMDAAVRSKRTADAWQVLEEMRISGLRPDKYTCSILVKGLTHEPTPAQVQSALDLLHEVDGALDKTLRTTLFHAVIEAAAQAGDSSMLMHVFSQTRQHQVTPTAAAYSRLREFAEARSISPGHIAVH
mmetsp:Transcript_6710/g.18417  ORF Transcript_6710/g.18417 Transcript_6710/m.18417 type:complete len:497 (-) Transcript_6710:158-1648(-)|eukprot:CAMPEP_0179075752 /NCGR_PEP_ID=MMETSP0796-20121207/33752_1 /TAXON_ID=73915 /ORGANISM="Pyrodinium bahamense, Strain pbaha01" /LENGTH=496 /DNA_ID=CAMNT_0020772993 /DNA_START=111 /DNA_END=1601 /DNA_ORIENTATION=+